MINKSEPSFLNHLFYISDVHFVFDLSLQAFNRIQPSKIPKTINDKNGMVIKPNNCKLGSVQETPSRQGTKFSGITFQYNKLWKKDTKTAKTESGKM
jgi:hypothetical protein